MSKELQPLRIREGKLHGIDSQFLTEGLRLVLLLPSFSLLFFFGAWAYQGESPSWWLDNIEPTVGFDLSTAFTLISSTILFGFCAGLYLHRFRVKLTRMVFRSEVEKSAESHRPISSMHGFPSVDGLISRTMASHNTALWMGISATLISLCIEGLSESLKAALASSKRFSATSNEISTTSLASSAKTVHP